MTARCPHCLTRSTSPLPNAVHVNCGEPMLPAEPTAVSLIRSYATTHDVVDGNRLRAAFDEYHVPMKARGPAFGAACAKGIIRRAGHVASEGESAKRADLKSYESLISDNARVERRVA